MHHAIDDRPNPEVHCAGGRLRGCWEREVAVFRGIPFADPPVGPLRFAAPRRVAQWDGIREAAAFGPPPPQAAAFGMDRLRREATGDDWLTLNVWSVDPRSGSNLPTMVWIQGGAYSIGMSGLPEYDGRRLALEGVVLVTFNYRVGVEGFGEIHGAPSNRGLLDQIAALEWVQDNIHAFGGDPDRVTIFGESAGGGSVAALLAMPRASGLFRRAIGQSVQGTFFAPELAADIASSIAAELGLSPTVANLSAVAPAALSAAADAVGARMAESTDRWGLAAFRSIPFSPVVGTESLPVTPWQALASGSARGVELVVGHTRNENRLFSALDGSLGSVTEEQAETALNSLAPGPDGAARYREAYPDAGPEELHELVNSDALFRMPSLYLAEAQIAAGGRPHVFELTWTAPGMGGMLGACHGLDVPLVFGNLDSGLPAMLIGQNPSAEAEALSARMRAAWTVFASSGDPGWSAYDAERRLVQQFDAQPAVVSDPEVTSRLIWRDHAFSALPLIDP